MPSLNELAKEVVAANALLSRYTKQAAEQKEVVDALKKQILDKMFAESIKSVNVDGIKLTSAKHVVPDVQDWDKVYEYIYAHKAFDMLHKRITIGALQDRIEAEGPIDGVKLINQTILKVTK